MKLKVMWSAAFALVALWSCSHEGEDVLKGADVVFDAVGVTGVAFIVFFMGRLLQKKVCPVAGERKFMNVTLDSISFADAVERIVELADEKRRYVVTPNVDHIIRVEKDKEFAAIYQKADLVLTDGMPLLWIAESFGAPIVERVTGADLFPAVCGAAAQKKIKMFFLGCIWSTAPLPSDSMVMSTISPTAGDIFFLRKLPRALHSIIPRCVLT